MRRTAAGGDGPGSHLTDRYGMNDDVRRHFGIQRGQLKV